MRTMFVCLALAFAPGLTQLSKAGENSVVWEARAADACFAATSQGRTWAVYRANANPQKPYIEQLFTPGGQQVLLDSPADHVHHHGLMFALSVDGVSYWEEGNRGGQQAVVETKVADPGVLLQTLHWTDPQGVSKLNEDRRIHLTQIDDTTWLTWQSTLTVPDAIDKVVLSGSHYYGLGMRFIRSFDSVARFRFPHDAVGEPVRGTEKLTPATWVACVGSVDGHPVTAVMFSHPNNIRHPAWWFTMDKPFAYQSATLNLWKQPLTLDRNDTLALTFGVALMDGDISVEQIEALSARWIKSLSDAPPTPVLPRSSK